MPIAYGDICVKHNDKINDGKHSVSNDSAPVDITANYPILNIHVSCKDLVKLDIGSQSDPMIVMQIPINGKFIEVARTEVVWNNCNPTFVKFFQALYMFETMQPLRFSVYDCDSENAKLEKHDYIGFVDTDVQTLVSNTNTDFKLEIRHPTAKNKRGTLCFACEQASASNLFCNMTILVSDLKKMKTFSKNSPFVQISKPSESGKQLPVFQTEVIQKRYQCTFKPFSVPLQVLCNGDLNTPITVSVYDFKKLHPAQLIGSYTASVQEFINGDKTLYDIENNRKKTGKFKFNHISVVKKPTFIDYIRSGIQLNLITAIDYTASNGDPRKPNTLHYIMDGRMNMYENCIWSVGSIVCPFDSDQMFPVYGFGGKINNVVSHCFPLTFDPGNPNVHGLQGIMAAYRNSFGMVRLSGPTLFAPIINSAIDVSIQSFSSSHTYTILMILTDGIINDMRETIDAIVRASDCPLSIIIVGIGNADFSAMEQLDADKNPLRSKTGGVMKRDIVQFVPFNKYLKSNGMGLAQEVLSEVPTQLDQFCASHGFVPNI